MQLKVKSDIIVLCTRCNRFGGTDRTVIIDSVMSFHRSVVVIISKRDIAETNVMCAPIASFGQIHELISSFLMRNAMENPSPYQIRPVRKREGAAQPLRRKRRKLMHLIIRKHMDARRTSKPTNEEVLKLLHVLL